MKYIREALDFCIEGWETGGVVFLIFLLGLVQVGDIVWWIIRQIVS